MNMRLTRAAHLTYDAPQIISAINYKTDLHIFHHAGNFFSGTTEYQLTLAITINKTTLWHWRATDPLLLWSTTYAHTRNVSKIFQYTLVRCLCFCHTPFIPRLHDQAIIKQTSSTHRANVKQTKQIWSMHKA